MGIAVSRFVVDGADSSDAGGATGAFSVTAGCSGAGEADGGGIDSVTSRSWEACAAWVWVCETALALLEGAPGVGTGAARRAGALGANFLPDLSAAKYHQQTALPIIESVTCNDELIAELEKDFMAAAGDGGVPRRSDKSSRRGSGHGHVGGANWTLNLVENPPGFNSFNLNHPTPSPRIFSFPRALIQTVIPRDSTRSGSQTAGTGTVAVTALGWLSVGSVVIRTPSSYASLATDAGRQIPRRVVRVRSCQDGRPEEARRGQQ